MSVVVALTTAFASVLGPGSVIDLELTDTAGHRTSVSTEAGGRPIVVVLLRVDCPLAGRYAPRLRELAAILTNNKVKFLVVNADPQADTATTVAFLREHDLPFSMYMDPDGLAARSLGASRSPQAFVLDAGRRVRYRGRINDQYEAGGLAKSGPTRHDLLEAVREVLAGRPVSVPLTPATGCVIDPPEPRQRSVATVTYSRDVAGVLQKHCAGCHRPGEAAPFSLLSFADAKRRAGTIAEVVTEGRMPPWHAAPGPVRFGNDHSLPAGDKQLILDWIRQGCAPGDPINLPTPPEPLPKWQIGVPDAIYPLPAVFQVPATGLVEYQRFRVDPKLTREMWAKAIEVRPGNRRVVHHVSVFLKPPTAPEIIDEIYELGSLGSVNLVAWTPGTGPTVFPPGMAKRIPAGWVLEFVVHYTTVGSPQEDRTELAMQFADPGEVRQEVATNLLDDMDLAIPPHAPRHTVEKTWTTDRDVLLIAMFPHMHLRGKSFQYVAAYPDGTGETLLHVPAYDFNWQHRYELAEPKRLPAGTVVRCVAVYDNSAANPANPNPDATVRTGRESADEMFNAYLDIALAGQDMAGEAQAAQTRVRRLWMAAAGLMLCLGGAWVANARRRATKQEMAGVSGR